MTGTDRNSRDLSVLKEADAIAESKSEAKVAPVKKALKTNNIVTGVSLPAIGAFLVWCMTQLVTVKSSNAQTSMETKANTNTLQLHESRLNSLEHSVIRSEVMNEMVLIRLGVTPPPKLLPDGGKE